MSEKIGEISIIEQPYVSKGFKYQVYMLLNKELPEAFLGDDPDAAEDDFDYYYSKDFELVKAKRIEQTDLPRMDQAFLQAFRKVAPERFKQEYEGKPAYLLFISLKEDEEGYRTPYAYWKKTDVVFDRIQEWLQKEDYRVLTGSAVKVSKFPWEKPKIKARIPITKEMFESMLKQAKEGEMENGN